MYGTLHLFGDRTACKIPLAFRDRYSGRDLDTDYATLSLKIIPLSGIEKTWGLIYHCKSCAGSIAFAVFCSCDDQKFKYTKSIRLWFYWGLSKFCKQNPLFPPASLTEKILQMIYINLHSLCLRIWSPLFFWGLYKVNICGILLPACILW